MAAPTHEWTVAGAVVEQAEGLLLVHNRRRNGSCDWSTPGGVIDAEDATIVSGLAREVEEETGLRVTAWEGPLYSVTVAALDLGWVMRCEVHRAVTFEGSLLVEDPDGIVFDAAFLEPREVEHRLAGCFPWVAEPLAAWLDGRWSSADPRAFRYDVRGSTLDTLEVVRAGAE
jgi:8-oxo-dGTP pyrophosphatase MutT (NUDIX family)